MKKKAFIAVLSTVIFSMLVSCSPITSPSNDVQNGKSAYELYCEAHPEYTGSEEEWLDDLVNGRLGNKTFHTVSFNTHCDIQVPSQSILHGEKAIKPTGIVRPNYILKGWEYDGEPRYFHGFVVTSDIVLDAVWEHNPNSTPTTSTPNYSGEKTIEVLVQTADHGWTGAVQSYAKEKVDEINESGKYKVKLTACDRPIDQRQKINDLLTSKESLHGIVILPIDNTLEPGILQIIDAGVPFVQFERIVSTPEIDEASNRVTNVLGDNYGIGKLTAQRFIQKGLQPGDPILIMPNDNSYVSFLRSEGFRETLLYEGGWTQAQVDNIEYTDYTGWSRTSASHIFETKGECMLDYEWIFTHDSQLSMGIFESLNSTRVYQSVKDHFKNGGVKALSSSSGLDEMYAILEGKHKADYKALLSDDCDLFDITYDPAMIQTAIQDLIDYLEGNEIPKTHMIPSEVVDSTNVNSYRGFERYEVYRK